MANRQARRKVSADETRPTVQPLRHITPFANEQDWAVTLKAMAEAQAERHWQVGQHIAMGIRSFESEIAAQVRRRQIIEDSLDPGAALRPAVALTIQARIHQLTVRLAQLVALQNGKTPKVRANIERAAPAFDPDAETREDFVRALLRHAVWVIRHSRFPRNGAPAGYQCSMPDPVVSFWDAFGREKAEVTKPIPSAKEISQCDAVLPWFYLVEPEARSVLFLRLIPLSWRKVGDILDISHTEAMFRERDAVQEIARFVFEKQR